MHSDEIEGCWWTLPKARTKARYDKLQLVGNKVGLIFESHVKVKAGMPVKPKPIIINALAHMIRDNNYFGLLPWAPTTCAEPAGPSCRT